MTVNSKVAVLVKNSIILWTLLASLSNWRVAALLTVVTHVALYFVKICPVEKEKVEQIFQHLRERCRSSKQPFILHRAGCDVAPENSLPSIQAVCSYSHIFDLLYFVFVVFFLVKYVSRS